jgi:tRNA dimethylallyltransferase
VSVAEPSSAAKAVLARLEVAPSPNETLVCVVGPTAGGKTALAVELCEILGGEIVSADSVQVYRGFDAASGKPDTEEKARARHHLIDVAEPLEPFDAPRFVELADAAIADIRARGKVAIVCGGTFLWVKTLISGLAEAPPADPEARARHRAIVEAEGKAALHTRLAAVDPVIAERLHPNDVVRVSRALEVFETSGKRLSDLQAAHKFADVRYPSVLVCPERTPDELTERVRIRVRGFVASGLLDEVRGLVASGCRDARAMGSVGYREALACVDGTLPEAELVETIVRSTRVFARRQRTWLGHEPVLYVR